MRISATESKAKTDENTADVEGFKATISSELTDLLVRQLAHELRNHNLYMTFCNFYSAKGLNLLSEYYKLRAGEEYLHHDWIRWYLQENGAVYKYPNIADIDETFLDLIDPIKLTVEVEKETTDMIYEIVDQAEKEKDYITLAWLNGNDSNHGALLLEQLEEESLSTAVLDIAQLNDGWLTKEQAIMQMYRK